MVAGTPVLASSSFDVEVQSAPGMVCPTAEQTLHALRDGMPEWQFLSEAPPYPVPMIRLAPAGADGLLLTLAAWGRAPEQRRVPLDRAECGAAAQTVALIAKIWLRRLPPAPPPLDVAIRPGDVAHPRASRPPASVSAPPVPDLNVQPDAGSAADAVASAEPLDLDAGPVPQPLPVELDAGALPTVDSVVTAGPPEEDAGGALPAPQPWLHLEAGVGGAVFEGLSPNNSAASAVAIVELPIRDFLGIEGTAALDTPLLNESGPSPSSSVRVDRSAFSLGVWATLLRPSAESTLRFGASAILERLQASGRVAGVSTAQQVITRPGLGVGVVWNAPLPVGGLHFWGGPLARWVPQDNIYPLDGDLPPGQQALPGVVISRFWLGISAGVSWRFF